MSNNKTDVLFEIIIYTIITYILLIAVKMSISY